ncbi:hypothetical protein AAV35_003860 [Salimicrobium jeotgali]|uniref:DUF819 domain-containing protein n=1 Tax=Salimicrobium jeotgali TaxID=1230341 RepID=K2FQH8_9BACI|nr:DUF819 family protein [Salimicrobium jeotgali]AKG04010.1 hypothetical protein AAV35_003860 [Salimicrobium jeotgali]EKE33051.1 hypothetical protein MJ3_01085 [Salimicrobium jeotgali]MBM7694954.1 putative membrane protein [Salimicrobium jeotgali]
MIESGFLYLGVIIGLAGLVAFLESSKSKFFKYVPGIVLIYFGGAILKTTGVIGSTETIDSTYGNVRDILLPMLIFLMLINCDLRKLKKLGPKMLIGYFTAAFSIMLGFVVTYLLFQGLYAENTWQALGALAGSWTGGSANMVIIQGILEVPENIFGYALIMDTVNYSSWVMIMFWLVPFAALFNKWAKSNTEHLDEITADLVEEDKEKDAKNITFVHMLGLLSIAIFVSAIAAEIGGVLPSFGTVVNATTWTILIVSIIGVLLAMTKLAKVPGSMDIANVFLYIVIALIASRADFSQLGQAPVYIISGFVILAVHAIIMLLAAKIFKLDLFTLGVSSLANIGGMASAPLLAGAYHRSLIPVGVLMALGGSFLGTYGGLLVAEVLSML